MAAGKIPSRVHASGSSSGGAERSANVFRDESSDETGAPTSWECQGAIVTSGGD